jgi:hypothetical protein
MLNTQNDLSDDDESFRKTISEIDELGVLIDDPKVLSPTHKILCHNLAEIGIMNEETAVNLVERI